jgi:hypothetical protein
VKDLAHLGPTLQAYPHISAKSVKNPTQLHWLISLIFHLVNHNPLTFILIPLLLVTIPLTFFRNMMLVSNPQQNFLFR